MSNDTNAPERPPVRAWAVVFRAGGYTVVANERQAERIAMLWEMSPPPRVVPLVALPDATERAARVAALTGCVAGAEMDEQLARDRVTRDRDWLAWAEANAEKDPRHAIPANARESLDEAEARHARAVVHRDTLRRMLNELMEAKTDG